MDDLPLHKIDQPDPNKLVLGHDPVPGAIGFRVQPVVKAGVVQPGRWAHTWDGSRTRHTFAAGHPPYRVQPLGVIAEGVWPPAQQPGLTVDPPVPPSAANYEIPAGAVTVTDAASLAATLARTSPADIRVKAGAYTRHDPVAAAAAHRVWCEAGVTLDFGVSFRNHVGWRWSGGMFVISDPVRASWDAGWRSAISNWYSGSTANNSTITDVTIHGSGAIMAGILLMGVGGATIRRVVVRDVSWDGLRLWNNRKPDDVRIAAVSDIDASGCWDRNLGRGRGYGTHESGLWVAHPVVGGVTRIRVRDCGWMGIWTADRCRDTTFSHLDVDDIWGRDRDDTFDPGYGIYLERSNVGNVYEHFKIGAELGKVAQGIKAEWDFGDGNLPGATDCVFRHGLIRKTHAYDNLPGVGFFLDEGSEHNEIHDVVFVGAPGRAGMDTCIAFPKNVNQPVSLFHDNDYSSVLANGGTRGCARHPNGYPPATPEAIPA